MGRKTEQDGLVAASATNTPYLGVSQARVMLVLRRLK